MTKKTVMGVYAPRPRLTRPATVMVAVVLIAVLIAAGLTLDPFVAPIFATR